MSRPMRRGRHVRPTRAAGTVGQRYAAGTVRYAASTVGQRYAAGMVRYAASTVGQRYAAGSVDEICFW